MKNYHSDIPDYARELHRKQVEELDAKIQFDDILKLAMYIEVLYYFAMELVDECKQARASEFKKASRHIKECSSMWYERRDGLTEDHFQRLAKMREEILEDQQLNLQQLYFCLLNQLAKVDPGAYHPEQKAKAWRVIVFIDEMERQSSKLFPGMCLDTSVVNMRKYLVEASDPRLQGCEHTQLCMKIFERANEIMIAS